MGAAAEPQSCVQSVHHLIYRFHPSRGYHYFTCAHNPLTPERSVENDIVSFVSVVIFLSEYHYHSS